MKKLLALTFAIFAAMNMNAQEICVFNPNNELDLDPEYGSELKAGTVIGETESIVAFLGADDSYKPTEVSATVNGFEMNGGIQCCSNPRDIDGDNPSTTLKVPTSGAFFKFRAKADGCLYVIIKALSHKAYTVFEDGKAIGYNFAAIGDASTDIGSVYQFILAGAGRYNLLSEAGIEKVEWAEQEYLKFADPLTYESHWITEGNETFWNTIKVVGAGVIWFKVYKGSEYILCATGTKIVSSGFAFSTLENVEVASGETTIIKAGSSITSPPKCATPEINFVNGKIMFSCETEGAEFASEIKVSDAKKYKESEINLSQTYNVTVYAYKSNYLPSDKVTRDIVIKGDGKAIIIGDVNNDGKVDVADHVKLSDIIMNK